MPVRLSLGRSSGLRLLPFFGFGGGHALDGFFRIGRFRAAVYIQEELAVLRFVQGFFIALGIAEFAERLLLNQFRSFGIIFDLADNLFQCLSSFRAPLMRMLKIYGAASKLHRAYYTTLSHPVQCVFPSYSFPN